MDIKGQISLATIAVGDSNTPLLSLDRQVIQTKNQQHQLHRVKPHWRSNRLNRHTGIFHIYSSMYAMELSPKQATFYATSQLLANETEL